MPQGKERTDEAEHWADQTKYGRDDASTRLEPRQSVVGSTAEIHVEKSKNQRRLAFEDAGERRRSQTTSTGKRTLGRTSRAF